jgi:hypothetical protein
VKVNRRQMLVSAVAATTIEAEAQQQPAAGQEDLAALARRGMKANRDAIDKVKLPIATEPAFVFKA